MNILLTTSASMEWFGWFKANPLIAVPLVLIVGLGLAICARVLLPRALELCGTDHVCTRVGFSEFLRKGQVGHSPARLAALLVYWVILLATMLLILHLMGISLVSSLASTVRAALPAVFAASCVVFFGSAIVWFCANVLCTLARNGGFAHADLLSKLVKWVGMLLVISLAAEQLGVEFRLIGAALQIALAAAALGIALAFGLGCKDLARDAVLRYLKHLRERKASHRGDLEG